jgi:protein-S-isoprenylcysteine O-methyltransferase Ste14
MRRVLHNPRHPLRRSFPPLTAQPCMRFLELKIPPPLVALLLALALYAALGPTAAAQAPGPVRWSLIGALVGLGAAFDLSAVWVFHRAKTTVNPLKPATASTLVSGGVYRITRNPMYVGMACFLIAWAAYLWTPWALLGPVAFVAYITRFQIRPEETVMANKFGADYRAYQARVRRWL